MKIASNPVVWGSSCAPGFTLVAGSRHFVEVDCEADRPAVPRVNGWPQGYELEAALDLPKGQPFTASPGLIERLQPTLYLSATNRTYQHSLETGDGRVSLPGLNLKEFVLTIPPELAGRTLTLRAVYRRNSPDELSDVGTTIPIVAPCNRLDSARIMATRIFEGVAALHYGYAITVADSMLELGLTDAAAWKWALIAAKGSWQYGKAISYLDRMFHDFGVMDTELGTTKPPQFNPDGPRDPSVQTSYKRQRDQLVHAQAEQEQQQQR